MDLLRSVAGGKTRVIPKTIKWTFDKSLSTIECETKSTALYYALCDSMPFLFVGY